MIITLVQRRSPSYHSHALSLVKRGEGNTTIIYLAPGVYSRDRNGEDSLLMPDNVHLVGDEAETLF
ncbi:hypothetical protein Ct9H90mP29_23460 [bacterium]|nr:MAG: hypothetical protein Ct9H90mP29_23460 [bacterium]